MKRGKMLTALMILYRKLDGSSHSTHIIDVLHWYSLSFRQCVCESIHRICVWETLRFNWIRLRLRKIKTIFRIIVERLFHIERDIDIMYGWEFICYLFPMVFIFIFTSMWNIRRWQRTWMQEAMQCILKRQHRRQQHAHNPNNSDALESHYYYATIQELARMKYSFLCKFFCFLRNDVRCIGWCVCVRLVDTSLTSLSESGDKVASYPVE